MPHITPQQAESAAAIAMSYEAVMRKFLTVFPDDPTIKEQIAAAERVRVDMVKAVSKPEKKAKL